MNSPRSIEMTINRNNIVDQVASFLYGIGVVHSSEEISNIHFGPTDKELVPIKVTFKEGVEILKF